jgi:hypothetical protein
MKLNPLWVWLVLLIVQFAPVMGQELKELPVQSELTEDTLLVNGYLFERKISNGDVQINVKSHGKVLENYSGIPGNSDDQTRSLNDVKVYKMFPGDRVQAIVMCSDGGKDGTGEYSILDLWPNDKVKALLDSDKYSLLGWPKVVDFNNDGTAEVIDYSSPFGQLDGPDHMFLHRIQIEKVFSFDSKKSVFVPSNNKFSSRFESEVALAKGKAKKGNLNDVLALSSIYWFAGKTKEGWDSFKKYYKGADSSQLIEGITAILSKDAYVQEQLN